MITHVILNVGGALADPARRAVSAGGTARPEHVLPNRPAGSGWPESVSCWR